MTLFERIDEACRRMRKGLVPVRLAADECDADLVLADAKAEIERLRGLKPELPPFPANGGSGLPRYGLRWNGPEQPLAVPMADGYWTPWHLADQWRHAFESVAEALGCVDQCEGHAPHYGSPDEVVAAARGAISTAAEAEDLAQVVADRVIERLESKTRGES